MTFVRVTSAVSHVTWTIDRPDRANAIGPTLATMLQTALAELYALAPRVLVVTTNPVVKASGRKLWLAGGDLHELAGLEGQAAGRHYAAQMSELCAAFATMPWPVVMAVDGAAIGGGAELALAGDLRLATAGSSLEFKQLKAKLATGYGTCRRLVQLIGLSRAQWLLLTCARVTAEEALVLGLVQEVVADAEALRLRVEALCEHLAQLPAKALAAQKRMLWHATESAPGASRLAELELFTGLWGSPEQRGFLEAFGRERSGE